MKAIRVLHIHWTAPPVTGGVETHLAAVVAQLRALEDLDVSCVTGTRSAGTEYDPALDITRAPDPADVVALGERCQRADVVHWHNPQWHRPAVTAAVAAHLRERQWPGHLVLDLHNIDEEPAHWDLLGQLAGHVVAHSPFVAGHAAARLSGADLAELPLALPLNEAAYRLPGDGGTVLLQPSRLTRWKGSHLSLESVTTLLEEGTDLRFVHAGTQHLVWPPGIPNVTLQRAEAWRKKGRIRFVQYEPTQSWTAIRSSHVVVHPTVDRGVHGEPFSLSVAQAVICGRHVVASDSGNLPELLAGYSAATIVPAGDGAALTEALRDAIARPRTAGTPADAALASRIRESFATAGRRHADYYLTLT